MNSDRVRASFDIPVELHERLHRAAQRQGCSARQLILRAIERLIAEESLKPYPRTVLPLVPAAGREMRPTTNNQALFS